MTFWILTLILAAIAMGFVCFPLFSSNLPSRSELDSEQTLYKARLLEIEKDLELGRLDELSAQAAKSEEARKLIKSSEFSKQPSVPRRNKFLVLLAAISLPLFSIPFYYITGSPDVISPPQQVSSDSSQPSMQELLKVAEKRLQSNPDDTKGWKVVGPVYMRMRRYEDAIKAYQNIIRVEGRNPEYLLKLADVHIEQTQGQINDEAKMLIHEVLSIDEEHSIAKFYTGIIALQSDKPDETMRIWQGMIDNAKGDEEWLPVVRGRVAELRALEKQTKLPALNEEKIKAVEEMNPEDRKAMIGQMVSNLAEKLEDDPDNKQGWERLIRSYIILGRSDDAEAALTSATRQFSNDKAFIAFLKNMIQSQNNSSNGGEQ